PANVRALVQRIAGQRLHLKRRIEEIHKHIMSLPAHYRYLAVPQSSCDLVLREMEPRLYSPDGIGRIGIISINERDFRARRSWLLPSVFVSMELSSPRLRRT